MYYTFYDDLNNFNEIRLHFRDKPVRAESIDFGGVGVKEEDEDEEDEDDEDETDGG